MQKNKPQKIGAEYRTKNGLDLLLLRVARRRLDDFARRYPPPQPPVKVVTVYGGIEDEIPDLDAPEYLDALGNWSLHLADLQFDVIADGIEIAVRPREHPAYRELLNLGIATGKNAKREFLRFVALADNDDMREVIQDIYYLSTTTERGIEEAYTLFNATWANKDIRGWYVKRSKAEYSRYYEDRSVATWAHYRWDEFCALPGFEQSVFVAQYRLHNRIEWLVTQDAYKGR